MILFGVCPWTVGNESQSVHQYHKMKKSLFKKLALGKSVFHMQKKGRRERKRRKERVVPKDIGMGKDVLNRISFAQELKSTIDK